jgi:hypothetical protein
MAALLLLCQCCLDLLKLGVDTLRSASSHQHVTGLIEMPVTGEITGGLRKVQHARAKHGAGNYGNAEHPPPIPGCSEAVICNIGAKNPDSYRQLVQDTSHPRALAGAISEM